MATFTLNPVDDTYVRGGSNSGTNFDGSGVVVKENSGNNKFKRRALLRFDLSSIPSGDNILAVTLRLYSGSAVSITVDVLEIPTSDPDRNWTEEAVTWDTAPSPGPTITNLPTSGGAGYIEVSDAALQSYVDGQRGDVDGVQFWLEDTQVENTIAVFHDKEDASGNAPELVVETDGVSEASALTINETLSVTDDLVAIKDRTIRTDAPFTYTTKDQTDRLKLAKDQTTDPWFTMIDTFKSDADTDIGNSNVNIRSTGDSEFYNRADDESDGFEAANRIRAGCISYFMYGNQSYADLAIDQAYEFFLQGWKDGATPVTYMAPNSHNNGNGNDNDPNRLSNFDVVASALWAIAMTFDNSRWDSALGGNTPLAKGHMIGWIEDYYQHLVAHEYIGDSNNIMSKYLHVRMMCISVLWRAGEISQSQLESRVDATCSFYQDLTNPNIDPDGSVNFDSDRTDGLWYTHFNNETLTQAAIIRRALDGEGTFTKDLDDWDDGTQDLNPVIYRAGDFQQKYDNDANLNTSTPSNLLWEQDGFSAGRAPYNGAELERFGGSAIAFDELYRISQSDNRFDSAITNIEGFPETGAIGTWQFGSIGSAWIYKLDTLPASSATSLTISESLSVSDAITLVNAKGSILTLSQALSATDGLTATNAKGSILTLSEALAATDAIALVNAKGSILTIGENLNVSDSLSATSIVAAVLILNETLNASDSITLVNSTSTASVLTIAETLSLADSISAINTKAGSMVISETLALMDAATLRNTIASALTLAENLSVSDALSMSTLPASTLTIAEVLALTATLSGDNSTLVGLYHLLDASVKATGARVKMLTNKTESTTFINSTNVMSTAYKRIGDERPPLRVQLLRGEGSDATPISDDLTSASAIDFIVQRKSDGSTSTFSGTLEDNTDKIVRYDWGTDELNTEGHYRYYVKITWGDGDEETFPNTGNLALIVIPQLS